MLYKEDDYKRLVKEPGSADEIGRSGFRRDYGRLLHSPAFRRLQGKTQLFPGHESDFFRNRLTHSLEVAQVAKGIATQLNESAPAFQEHPIDTDLVEFAALAHDLGHPPFGHNGEAALDDCMKAFGGFEGNAQTLRLVASVEKKVLKDAKGQENGDYCGVAPNGEDLRAGLNLTYRTLAAVLKYDKEIPGKRPEKAKLCKGYYGTEASLVQKLKQHVGKPTRGYPFKTVECQIMDLADDIAYSTYDLEDAMKAGFSHPLGIRARLLADPDLFGRVYRKVHGVVGDATQKEVFRTLNGLLDFGPVGEGSEVEGLEAMTQLNQSILIASQGYLRASFTSSLIKRFLAGISVDVPKKGKEAFSQVTLRRETLIEIESLKHLNYELMIMSPRLKVVEYRGYELVQTIFTTLDSDSGYLLLPEDYRLMYERVKSKVAQKRLICDFIAGMTDRYAVEFYGRLKETGASIFKPI